MKWFTASKPQRPACQPKSSITAGISAGGKKLYVPTALARAAGNLLSLVDDQSPKAFRDIQRILEENHASGGRLAITSMIWHDHSTETSDGRVRECECASLNGSEVTINEMLAGITGRTHTGCDCHVIVTFNNGHRETVTPATSAVSFNVEPEFGGWGIFDDYTGAGADRRPGREHSVYNEEPSDRSDQIGERMY